MGDTVSKSVGVGVAESVRIGASVSTAGVGVTVKSESVVVGATVSSSVAVGVVVSLKPGSIGVGVAVSTSVGVGVAVSPKPGSVGVEDELEGSISVEVTIAGVEKTPVGNKVAAATLPVVDTGKEATRPVKACVGNKAVEATLSKDAVMTSGKEVVAAAVSQWAPVYPNMQLQKK